MPTLEQQLEEFRRRIGVLEEQGKKAAGALQLAPHQVGPRPGWFRAARIEGTQMVIDFSASQAGTSPLITVNDTAGVRRVEMGNLAAKGVSPAQYGLRANDASGNPIFDSLGLIAVMSALINGGTQGVGPLAGVAGPPTGLSGFGGEVVATTGTFNLTRQSSVLLWAIVNGYVQVAGGGPFITTAPIYFQTDGVSEAGTAYTYVQVFANTDANRHAYSGMMMKVSTLAAGSHTINVIWNSQEGTSDSLINSNIPLFAFLMGT